MAPVVIGLLLAAVVGICMRLAIGMLWGRALAVGVLVFCLLRVMHWHQQLYGTRELQQGGWQEFADLVQQQERLVRQLASQVPWPWWARVLGWCACMPLFIVSVLMVPVGQFWVLWRQPQPLRVWLKVCVLYEPFHWMIVTWAGLRLLTANHPSSSWDPTSVFVLGVSTAFRAAFKLLFDVEDKLAITLLDCACCSQAFFACFRAGLWLMAFMLQGVLGGTWLLGCCRFKETPWQLAAHLKQLPQPRVAI